MCQYVNIQSWCLVFVKHHLHVWVLPKSSLKVRMAKYENTGHVSIRWGPCITASDSSSTVNVSLVSKKMIFSRLVSRITSWGEGLGQGLMWGSLISFICTKIFMLPHSPLSTLFLASIKYERLAVCYVERKYWVKKCPQIFLLWMVALSLFHVQWDGAEI